MIPILTTAEMAAVDEQAPDPVEVLIERAGAAVAHRAIAMLGGTYGKRVVVVAGKGNNGADGRAAARRLARRGVRVEVLDATMPACVPDCDLIIDAAYGTGFRGEYHAPDPRDALVLAVDIPSGVHGDTGEASPDAVMADATVTFHALKPGLLLGEGPDHAGTVEVVDIGLRKRGSRGRRTALRAALVEDSDARAMLPSRDRQANKWTTAVYVLAGSPGMYGAATLSAKAAMRAGAGMVRLGIPGGDPATVSPSEVVVRQTPAVGFGPTVLDDMRKCKALIIGPGLGTDDRKASEVRRIIAEAPIPVVIDADAITILGAKPDLAARPAETVLTPHEGEFARLAGAPPGHDRLGDVRGLAEAVGATVLLKGPTTLVSDRGSLVLAAARGGARLATAGTGDVLSGILGALLAQGMPALMAAAIGAHIHGAAAELGAERGLVAGDLLDLLPRWLSNA